MPEEVAFTVTLPSDLAAALRAAASGRGWTAEGLIRDCVAQHLEIAVRHRVLVERMETIDAALLEMAEAVVELAQPGEDAGIDLTKVCRYRPETAT